MFKKIVFFVLTIFTISQVAIVDCKAKDYQEEDKVAGTWTGRLDAGGTVLRIVFNISKNDMGEYTATLDSPDQGAKGIPIENVTFEGNQLTFSVPSVSGKYEGTVSGDGKTMKGTWSQRGSSFTLNMEKGQLEPFTTKSEVMDEKDLKRLSGKWLGTLKIESAGLSLRLVFNLSTTPENRLQATLDSPDQGAEGIPVSKVEFINNHIMIEVKAVKGSFEGDMSDDSLFVEGDWTQGGVARPLQLKKVEEGTEIQGLYRPQEPKKPYPYLEEEVIFPNSEANIELAGTITTPKGRGSFPAVILITGSGPQDRNESFMTHKPFLVWADHLTRNGIAVLRYDDRGFGKSTGDFSSATSLDFVTDVQSAVKLLKTRPEIDIKNIGLVGHSEGGLIAPIVAAESQDIAFIVLMAGPGITGIEVLKAQQKAILKANGISDETSKAMQELNDKLFNIILVEKDDSLALVKLRISVNETMAALDTNIVNELRAMGQTEVSDAMLEQLTSPWFRYFLTHNPQKWLEQVKCPVLALNGEKDVQVTPKENLAAIKKALEVAGNKNFTVKELPGLNHLFQQAEIGAVSEYSQIEETTSPEALNMMSEWIHSVIK